MYNKNDGIIVIIKVIRIALIIMRLRSCANA